MFRNVTKNQIGTAAITGFVLGFFSREKLQQHREKTMQEQAQEQKNTVPMFTNFD